MAADPLTRSEVGEGSGQWHNGREGGGTMGDSRREGEIRSSSNGMYLRIGIVRALTDVRAQL